MRHWTFLFIFSLLFASCGYKKDSVVVLGQELLNDLDRIYAWITDREPVVDDSKNVEGPSCKKNLPAACKLFSEVKDRLEQWLKLTRYPVAQSMLSEIDARLSTLKKAIENLPDGQNKKQLKEKCSQLDKYLAFLKVKKDVS
ncbi:hypothetical protein [Cardinium endosymbiont of Nabis limbatus]|uniref:hypothetical protein n=1 Tax=Cardinium endosymbiont of Nabis limbatus TaxID=3066217 RepID=UPI003AF3A34A